MRTTWIASDNVITPLGNTTEQNYQALQHKKSGLSQISFPGIVGDLYLGKIHNISLTNASYTHFESLVLQSIQSAIENSNIDTCSPRTIFILSTTKGNIELIRHADANDPRISLPATARVISNFFNNPNTPVIISNACTSGVVALLTGKYLLESGQYDHAVVVGADILSAFIISGFQSLNALSNEECKPFDLNRKGINLGEAVATLILTTDRSLAASYEKIKIVGGGLSNDANHISGPSRTGEELSIAIEKAIVQSGIERNEIGFISAHGTATQYNDEMEANAFYLSELSDIPTNSLKGYFGHTLGAAGILESVMSIHALKKNELIPSYGFTTSGVSKPLNIIRERKKTQLSVCLKTASGFGGCNAAMILQKDIS